MTSPHVLDMESEKQPPRTPTEGSLDSETGRDFATDDPELLALDRSCVRTLDFTVLPIAAAFYFLSFVDRANIGE